MRFTFEKTPESEAEKTFYSKKKVILSEPEADCRKTENPFFTDKVPKIHPSWFEDYELADYIKDNPECYYDSGHEPQFPDYAIGSLIVEDKLVVCDYPIYASLGIGKNGEWMFIEHILNEDWLKQRKKMRTDEAVKIIEERYKIEKLF